MGEGGEGARAGLWGPVIDGGVQIFAKGSSSIRNAEGDAHREVKVDVAFDCEVGTADHAGCRGADCERTRESDFSGAVTGWLVACGV